MTPGRILLIDDNAMVRRSIKRMASKYVVIDCATVDDAMELIAMGHQFDLVLCDREIGTDPEAGLLFHRHLYAMRSDLARRFVIISGHLDDTGPGDPPRLRKPCRRDTLNRAIESVVTRGDTDGLRAEPLGLPTKK